MELSTPPRTTDSFINPYSDDEDAEIAPLPSIRITPPSTPPPYNSALAISPNQAVCSPGFALSVPPTPSVLEKGLPPSYAYPSSSIPPCASYHDYSDAESQTHHPIRNGPNQVFLLLPRDITQLHVTTSSDSQESRPRPSFFQTLSFIHISAALLTGLEVLDLLYMHHVEDLNVLGGGIFAGPLCLLWGLLAVYFGSGVALCFL